MSSTLLGRASARPTPRTALAATFWSTLAALLLASPGLAAAAATNDGALAPTPALASGVPELAAYAPALAALTTMLACAGALLAAALLRRHRIPDEEID